LENKNNDLSSLRIDRTQAKNPEARGKKINLIVTILIIILILAAAIWGYNSTFSIIGNTNG
jgi:flagellar basal body-associated protein FliL